MMLAYPLKALTPFLFIILFLNSAHAQSSAPPSIPNVEVVWYSPQMRIATKADRSRVILSGKTTAGNTVRITKDEIPAIDKSGNVTTIPVAEVASVKSAVADERGIFELDLELPRSNVQLPLEVKTRTGQTRIYQLALAVQKDIANVTNQKEIKSPYGRRKWGVWAGVGVNYLKYDQSSSDIPSSLTLESFDMPTIYGKVVYAFDQIWAIQGTANRAPGRTTSSDAVKISQGTYNWTYLTGELTYYHPNWKIRYKKFFSEFGAQLGLQYHLVPFFARSSTTDPAQASIETNEILMGTVGGTWLVHYDRYWMLETFLRYQTPIATGRLFEVNYKFAFDGSVGLIYNWKPDWRVGAFWYGQYQSYNFDNHRDKYFSANGGGGPKISGEQKLFFSNIEARIGWEFD